MTKEEHIKYWVETSEKDFQRAELLFREKDFVFALFCLHLVLEKLLKANWVKNNISNDAPRIHNLVKILNETSLELSDEDKQFLSDMNKFQLEGRYPDYSRKLRTEFNLNFAGELFSQAKILIECFKKNLQ